MTRRLEVAGPVESVPWEPLAGESSKAYRAFASYLELGPRRSLRRLGETSAKVRQLEVWSSKYNWVARARAFDAWRAREDRLDQVDAARRMRRAHAAVASTMILKGAERIREIDSKRLSVREAALLVELGAKLERAARGEPAEFDEADGTVETPGSLDGQRRVTGERILALLRANPAMAEIADELRGLVDFGPDLAEPDSPGG